MSASERLDGYVRAVAAARGLPIEEAWVPAVALNLQRLLEAAAIVEKAGLGSADCAAGFEP